MFKENFPLHELTSYRIGGPARYFFEAKTVDELKCAVDEAKRRNLEFFILGGGTNLLIGDEGIQKLVLKPALDFIEVNGNEVNVGAGTQISKLLDFLAEKGLGGMEWAGGLPGTFGGAVRGNAGAFGGEIKDVVKSVRSLDTKTLQELERSASDAGFDYRSSIFKKGAEDEIILSAVLGFKDGDPEEIKKDIAEKISYRRERHPLEYPNAGSVFKNIELGKVPESEIRRFTGEIKTDPFPVVPVAYVLSEAGLRGIGYGGAMISPKHPNFIVNVLGAKASDVRNLMELARTEVKNKFGIEIEPEIISV